MNVKVFEGYATDAERLIEAFEAIPFSAVLEQVAEFLDDRVGRLVEIGAGTGRDASWLASCGYDVVAVEQIERFREARLHPSSPRIEWADDSLPSLDRWCN